MFPNPYNTYVNYNNTQVLQNIINNHNNLIENDELNSCKKLDGNLINNSQQNDTNNKITQNIINTTI